MLGKARMDLILDTHALVWLLLGHEEFGNQQRSKIENPENRIFLSAVSGFEIANKHRTGRFPDAPPILELMDQRFANFDWIHLPVELQHARLAGTIASPHKDPFDRLLAAQSMIENIPVMTVDRRLAELGARVVW